MGFKSLAREDATFHSTLFCTPKQVENFKIFSINSWKSAQCNVLQHAVPTLDHWRRVQHTFQCFWTKTCHVARRMKSFRKGHVTCQMLSIKKRLLSSLFCTKYSISCRDVRCYNNIKWSGKYSSDFVQNFAEKNKQVLLCSANAWIRTHVTFLVIPKRCCCFSVVQSFQ